MQRKISLWNKANLSSRELKADEVCWEDISLHEMQFKLMKIALWWNSKFCLHNETLITFSVWGERHACSSSAGVHHMDLRYRHGLFLILFPFVFRLHTTILNWPTIEYLHTQMTIMLIYAIEETAWLGQGNDYWKIEAENRKLHKFA